MLISHGAAMSFDRVFPPASIPGRLLHWLLCSLVCRLGCNLAAKRRPPARLSRALSICLLSLLPLVAEAQSIRLLRDADIEHGLAELAQPVLQAAGLNPRRVRILVVDDSGFNAFVIDQRAIFVNYGLILKAETPEMLQAVLAHEAAHITNGHIGRRGQNARSASTAAGFGTALALLAAAAGGGEAAFGIAVGTQSSALRSFLSHTRAEEASADRSALAFLTRAGINPEGMVALHRIFAGQEVLGSAHQDPYMRSHPLTRDRIRAAEAYVASLGPGARPGSEPGAVNSPDAAYWLARVKGKLSAFTRAPSWSKRRLQSEGYADVKRMRAAIVHHRQNDLAGARREMQALLGARPQDAFYHELWGQILYENRRWSEAEAAFGRAAALAPNEPLILSGLGRAQLSSGRPGAALVTMEKARDLDFRNATLLRDMSLAYAQTKQSGMAALVTAERYALQGRLKDAGPHAQRATGLLPNGSPAWRRAQDVLIAFEQDEKRKKK
ncbi:M48 family metalloprotease [Phaeobacter sp. B1627]|uniref:M48 family metalloprotease n=1 Tax=Phaeobacter sp. B1627 TaxID=2583809 RepID=UPI00111B548E|nr:M48 family metalloprotease [Phaeobacter sp. B1627]TNJ44075.1 peptidase M48 [Phaeobacter sp. B1627]